MSEHKNRAGELLAMVQQTRTTSLSCIGMAKNVGKTVAFNHLIQAAAERSLTLGLTSIGRDGERRDEVFLTPKPRIFAPAGSLLATATGTLKHSEAQLEIVQRTGFASAMGEIIVGRTRTSGLVELAGPTLISEHQRIQELFVRYGAELTLIDGALDRVSPAVPGLAQSIVLSTGAALGQSIELVLAKTQDRINRLSLPQVASSLLSVCRRIMDANQTALLSEDLTPCILDVRHSLLAGDQLKKLIGKQTEFAVLSGAVGDVILESLLDSRRQGRIQLVLRNGAALFCSSEHWRRFSAAGGSIRVVEPIRLLAVTLNPVSPTGGSFNDGEFFHRMSAALAPLPVFDLVQSFGPLPRNYTTQESK